MITSTDLLRTTINSGRYRNFLLLVGRGGLGISITKEMAEFRYLSSKELDGTRVMPIYIFHEKHPGDYRPNLPMDLRDQIKSKYQVEILYDHIHANDTSKQ